jgi:hypothetical protein
MWGRTPSAVQGEAPRSGPPFAKGTAETRNERLPVDFPGQNKRAVFEPSRIVVETVYGIVIEARDNPEESFEGQRRETLWDDIHVAYTVDILGGATGPNYASSYRDVDGIIAPTKR